MLIPAIVKKHICQLEVEGLSQAQWYQLFRVLRHKSLAASFYFRLIREGKENAIPQKLQAAFLSAVTFSEAQKRQVNVQLKKLCHLFSESEIEFVMLKGAAYVASDTVNCAGRLMSDIDICVRIWTRFQDFATLTLYSLEMPCEQVTIRLCGIRNV